MASTRESSNNKGAAEEPSPSPSSSSAAAPSYDPREYQPPHPDDRDNDGLPSKVTKGNATTEGGDKGKDKDGIKLCGWCEKEGAPLRCAQCKSEWYCDKECQKVSAGKRELVGGLPP